MSAPVPGGGVDSRTANVTLTANVDPYAASMAAAQSQTSSLAGAVDKLQEKLSGLTRRAGVKLLHFAAGDATALTGATASAALFEHQLSTLHATSAVTGTSFKGLKTDVESAFGKFPVSRGQVA